MSLGEKTPQKDNNTASYIEYLDVTASRKRLFGEIIAYRRRVLRLTQEDVAKEVNCSITTVCFVETARCKDYRLYFIERLATVLQLNVFVCLLVLLSDITEEKIEEIFVILDRTEESQD